MASIANPFNSFVTSSESVFLTTFLCKVATKIQKSATAITMVENIGLSTEIGIDNF